MSIVGWPYWLANRLGDAVEGLRNLLAVGESVRRSLEIGTISRSYVQPQVERGALQASISLMHSAQSRNTARAR